MAEVEKTVLVVIDALRADQLVTATAPLMPYLQGQMASGGAQGYILHTAAPTVTLPRIKVCSCRCSEHSYISLSGMLGMFPRQVGISLLCRLKYCILMSYLQLSAVVIV